jgi:hypothetical protein
MVMVATGGLKVTGVTGPAYLASFGRRIFSRDVDRPEIARYILYYALFCITSIAFWGGPIWHEPGSPIDEPFDNQTDCQSGGQS